MRCPRKTVHCVALEPGTAKAHPTDLKIIDEANINHARVAVVSGTVVPLLEPVVLPPDYSEEIV